MTESIQGMRQTVKGLQALLEQGGLLTFAPEETQRLMEDSRKLLQKVDTVAESYLTVGILGGTGVGKSSLMNALAGVEIASTSHRRPHTDQVLVYRYASVDPPPGLEESGVPHREISHEAEAIRQIILCDLPDFDSLAGEHRRHVQRFLDQLDVLVWVTSPEKYADARFYDFLRKAPKARQNFYFVMNKVDLVFMDRALGDGYEQVAKMIERFQQYLVENGVTHPLIYALSAQEVVQGRPVSGWSQFESFRHLIFQHRAAKEIASIKAGNLDVEVKQFLTVLDNESLSLEMVHKTLQEILGELDEEREAWGREGGEELEIWIEGHFDRRMYSRMAEPTRLVGPGYLVAVIIREWQRRSRRDEDQAILEGLFDRKAVPARLERQLERLSNRLATRLLRRGLTPGMIDRMRQMVDVGGRWQALLDRLKHFIDMRMTRHEDASSKAFRLVQYLVYSLLLLCFLGAVGGETAWRRLIEHHGLNDVVLLVAAVLWNLFSPLGLAALGSYILLLLFAGFWFYGRHKKILQRRTQRFIESLKYELGGIWKEELDSLMARLREYDQEVVSQLSLISRLLGGPART